ncbi:MAG: hypothetical protein KA731_02920 [Candidatus Moranbacteria bacterium]|nr:hypothetical protein [Candidatus Moranbacteria bacterium]MBP6034492.1 hypothetical protein [Candidatus Moranbacteria bacterium]MBP7696149.1 hypothetical protein [Candidatus Moranbacteria bacterium]
MSFAEPFCPIPPQERRCYLISRVVLYILCLALALFFALRIIFPTLPFGFNFRTPQSTKNTFLDPRQLSDQTPLQNGKIAADQTLIGNFDSPGTFSRIRISFDLSQKSGEAARLKASISRSYRSFFLPIDDTPVASFEHPLLYQDQEGIYYAQDGGSLKRFVSTRAYLSRYPASFAVPLAASLAETLPVSDEWIGFRVGSLISFADGIFLVTSEHEIRPFGDPGIFLSMGYRFEDVIPAHEEEVGIYERGRILLYGAAQSEGTVFRDTDSGVYLLVHGQRLRPITSPEYRDFLITSTHPIEASFDARAINLSCLPTAVWWSATRYTCDIPESSLSSDSGSAFQLALRSEAPIDIDTLTVSMITDRTSANFRLFGSQIKTRLLSRFGIGE